jgi:hypothetical protein
MATAPTTRLDKEIKLYEAHKAEWLKNHRNEFVVVKGNAVLGFFSEFHNAYFVGAEKYGTNNDFLVKRVVPREPVFMIF